MRKRLEMQQGILTKPDYNFKTNIRDSQDSSWITVPRGGMLQYLGHSHKQTREHLLLNLKSSKAFFKGSIRSFLYKLW
jgi:hypothetical protein